MSITPEQMIEAGGVLWKKHKKKRIYLDEIALDKLFDVDLLALKRLKKHKKVTYYDFYTEQFYSANGVIIRAAISRADEDVTKC